VVKVKVLEVDEKRKRIALTMRLEDKAPQGGAKAGGASGPRDLRPQGMRDRANSNVRRSRKLRARWRLRS